MLDLLRGASQTNYIGMPMSQLTHALQTAHAVREAGRSEKAVVAGLLHDIGHLCAAPDVEEMEGLGILHHEDIGADFLAELGFDPDIVEIVRLHVQAKRYCCFRNPRYYDQLSEASRGTLVHQRGPMRAGEVALYVDLPNWEEIVQVRACEEAGQHYREEVIPPLEAYLELIERFTS